MSKLFSTDVLSTGNTRVHRFTTENMLFFEKEEIEYNFHRTKMFDCLRFRNSRHYVPFTVVSLVFCDAKKEMVSVSLQQNQKESNLVNQGGRIQVLMQKLLEDFGKIFCR